MLNVIGKCYTDVIRGTPAVTQLLIIYFVIFSLGDLFSGVSMAFFQTAMLYYITMLLNIPESQSFLVMLCAIGVALCLFPSIIKFSRKYNKKILLVALFEPLY